MPKPTICIARVVVIMDELSKLQKQFARMRSALNDEEDYAKADEVVELVASLVEGIKDAFAKIEMLAQDMDVARRDSRESIEGRVRSLESALDNRLSSVKSESRTEYQRQIASVKESLFEEVTKLYDSLTEVRDAITDKETGEIDYKTIIESSIKGNPKLEALFKPTREQLRELIETDNEDEKIDAKHLKNIPGKNYDYEIPTLQNRTQLLVQITSGIQKRLTDLENGGGTGTAKSPTSGAVNGTNQTFVFSTAPSLISVDQGRFMQKVSSDGSVNWTGTTTVVLTVAPTFDIFAL